MARARRAGSDRAHRRRPRRRRSQGRGGCRRAVPASSAGRRRRSWSREVQTGGASASDEFVEVANQGAGAGRPARARGRLRDVVGLDRHAQGDMGGVDDPRPGPADPARRMRRGSTRPWPTRRTRAGSRRPVARSRCGWSAVRSIDSVGWGDATNAFVEGTAAPAPPAGSSLERAPGGPAGNGTDTNDNAPGLVRPGSPVAAGPGGAARPGSASVAHSVGRSHADGHASRPPDADPRSRAVDRPRRPSPTPTPTPTPHPDADAHPDAHTQPDPDPGPQWAMAGSSGRIRWDRADIWKARWSARGPPG